MTYKSAQTFTYTCDICGVEVTTKRDARPAGWRQVVKTGSSYYASYHDVCKSCFAVLDPTGLLAPKKKLAKKKV
jgi:hypothetical protein